MVNEKKSTKGIWFYGLSGSGKTYISKILYNKMNNSVLVDGDIVRKFVSTDLSYFKEHREIQIKRVLGICKIIIKSKKFPIASTVYFNKEMKNHCMKNNIIPIRVERKNFIKILKTHRTYKNRKNVVGKDISYESFKTEKIINDLSENFIKKFKLFQSFSVKW
ncbi:adenylyl-sulfate kinase [Candidatus Pelagibacter sp.]|nr:adenylyl-sulfate kinase [Candidatus Pelagibacter sp.]